METRYRNKERDLVISYESSCLLPLEIWHGKTSKGCFYELTDEQVLQELPSFLEQVRVGHAETAFIEDTKNLKGAAGFSKVIFCGGKSVHYGNELQRIMQDMVIEVSKAGSFSAWPGAKKIFEEQGWKTPLALDLGQTSLKVLHSKNHRFIPRDESFLPRSCPDMSPEKMAERLKAWLMQTIRKEEEFIGGSFDGLCLALPVKLTGTEMEPSTYLGLQGNAEVFFAELEKPIVLINDAALTALGFHSQQHSTLVITWGYGLGGALCRV